MAMERNGEYVPLKRLEAALVVLAIFGVSGIAVFQFELAPIRALLSALIGVSLVGLWLI